MGRVGEAAWACDLQAGRVVEEARRQLAAGVCVVEGDVLLHQVMEQTCPQTSNSRVRSDGEEDADQD